MKLGASKRGWVWLSLNASHAAVILLIHGAAGVIGLPASQLIVYDIVGRERLPSAIRLNATSRYLAILLGPAVGGGLMLLLGPGLGLLVNILIYAPFTLFLLRIPYTGTTCLGPVHGTAVLHHRSTIDTDSDPLFGCGGIADHYALVVCIHDHIHPTDAVTAFDVNSVQSGPTSLESTRITKTVTPRAASGQEVVGTLSPPELLDGTGAVLNATVHRDQGIT